VIRRAAVDAMRAISAVRIHHRARQALLIVPINRR
jgi:hypothetical protein